jgi:septum formation protein
MTLMLASSSPRRQQLLWRAGLSFRVEPPHIEERSPRCGEDPELFSQEMARLKAEDVAARLPAATILAADTVVVIDGVLLGKPSGPSDATRMLRQLRGRPHQVRTSVAVLHRGALAQGTVTAEVFMRAYSDREIERYVTSGEPLDKAGAYAVQELGGRLVERVLGCYNTVVGLPLCLVFELLARVDEDETSVRAWPCDHRA